MTPGAVEDMVRFLAAVAVFALVAVGIGMLVARRLDRWAAAFADDDPPEMTEEPGDDARSDDRS